MSLINIPQVQEDDSATPDSLNSRFNIIAAAINGGLDNTNIAADSITAANLAPSAVGTAELADGSVTMQKISNPYKFRAHSAADQTGIASSVWTTVVLGTEDYDTNNNFASNTFTAPVAGYYHFDAQLATTNLAGTLMGAGIRLWKNGTTAVSGSPQNFDNNVTYDFLYASLSDTIQLAPGDTIALQGLEILTGGTGGFASVDSLTRLSGYLVSV